MVTTEKVCPVCAKGSLSKKLLDTRDIVSGDSFSIVECVNCGVKSTQPIPRDMSRYYESIDIGSSFMRGDPKIYAFFKNMLLKKEMRRILRNVKSHEFLDVGCGTGSFSRLFRDSGHAISGADSADSPPPLLGGIPYFRIDYDTYDIAGIDARPRAFIFRHLLEHIKDPYAFLEKMLNLGAREFYILLPNADSIKWKLLGEHNWQIDPPRHLWHFGKRSLDIIFERLGMDTTGHGYETIPTLVPSLYRYLRLKGYPKSVYDIVNPKSVISTLSMPLDLILPNDLIWFIARKR